MPSPFSPAFSRFYQEFLDTTFLAASAQRQAITAAYRLEEAQAVRTLLANIPTTPESEAAAENLARKLVTHVRQKRRRASGIDALMAEFSLSSEEGVALMCLAEALLRIPDEQTANRLIADKISRGDWQRHLGASPSLFVNAATWGLLITGKLVATNSQSGLVSAINRLIAKGGEGLIRKAVDLSMRMLGRQFVTGQTIQEALANSREPEKNGYCYSYDMLGEAALTQEDAKKYFLAYEAAIHAIGAASQGRGIFNGPGISVKLSALHPRYSRAQHHRVVAELLPRLKQLVLLAKHYQIGLNIDAEEADRLELSLDIIHSLAYASDLADFDGLGIVVQAYQKRCPWVIDYLVNLAHQSQRKFMIRLVKGAYWDTEIKRSQQEGLTDYPVYTRKVYTDVSYIVCAQKLLAANEVIYAQFATHNAHTLATIYTMAQAQGVSKYEFQCLHGMGETLYDQVVGSHQLNIPCRIYAPVGSYDSLLAYLVRRLLENGANSSFVNQIVDPEIPIEKLIANPVAIAKELDGAPHPKISLPADLYQPDRKNAPGIDLTDDKTLENLAKKLAELGKQQWQSLPILADSQSIEGTARSVCNPADHQDVIGTVIDALPKDAQHALVCAKEGLAAWAQSPAQQRAACLRRAADAFVADFMPLLSLLVREAGKSIASAIAEIREAIDFLRYYASLSEKIPDPAQPLGVVTCISPWNFPLAIFTGQISAALAAGNVVLAKPAEQTPLIAHRAVTLLHEAGIPPAVLQYLPGPGESIGAQLVSDHRVNGVIFTGSTEVAKLIQQTLAQRSSAENLPVLIAETGGQNAMIVDSSALPEQVVQDVLSSAFDSAGQRCSALRILCVQEEIAGKVLSMLKAALEEWRIGYPECLSTDMGPVIDAQAKARLLDYLDQVRGHASTCGFHQTFLKSSDPALFENGHFIHPSIIGLTQLSALKNEVFGPVLHVLRYKQENLSALITDINAMGYGLTLGIHSRINETIDFIVRHARVGNIYVNRNIVGAVVGTQPFGGEGKSGTGPKAGGPLYLHALQRSGTMPFTQSNTREHSAILEALLHWIEQKPAATANTLATLYRHYQANNLLEKTQELPGPTGEKNTLSFYPRGHILCAGDTQSVLLHQLMLVFLTGNTPCIEDSIADMHLIGCPEIVKKAILPVSDFTATHFALCLAHGEQVARLAMLLAKNQAGVTPILATDESTIIPIWRLFAERALCINTTAAGGNASLMALEVA